MQNSVVNYAVAMSNKKIQKYTLCGEYVSSTTTYSDCSGMTKLRYLQVGYYLEHYADAQANNYGKRIYNNLTYKSTINDVETYDVTNASASLDYSKLQKGNLLFFLCSTNNNNNSNVYVNGGIGLVAMYIGDGKMVHFT